MTTTLDKYKLSEEQKQQKLKALDKYKLKKEVEEEEQPQGLLSKAGQFVKDVAVETTKPLVQSIAAPYQLGKILRNIAEAPKKEVLESQIKDTSSLIKRLKELESAGKKGGSEYNQIVNQLQGKKTTITPSWETTVKTGVWGDIEAPKTTKEVLGTGAKTLSLAGTPAVGGALWTGGEALQQEKSLPEVATYATGGAILGKTGELAFKALGNIMKVGGKALAATKVGGETAGFLSATEKNAERVMASLIKPLKKNLSFGKRPALELAREVAKADKVPGNWDDLVSFTSKAKQKSGKEIGKFYNKADKTIKTRFNAETALKTIDNAMDEAAAKNNTALMNRLSAAKQAITQNLVKEFDEETGQWVIKSTGTRNLTKLKPSEVQSLIGEIGDQVKWTGNYSDDLTVNRALQDTYRALRRGFESGLSKENKATGALARRLNEKYGNLTSALDAVNYRKDVVNRQALVSLTDQEAAIAGGLFTAIRGGGNIGSILAGIGSGTISKLTKSPWFATNLTKTIMKLSPAKRQSIFLKYPMLRGVVNQTLKTTGKGIEKFGSVLAGTPKAIRKVQTTPVSELGEKASKLMPFGATIDDVSKQSSKKAGVPKTQTIDAGLAKTIRESKGLSADDIMKKYPDIQLKRDVPAKDIHGNKIEIPKGEVLTPYEVKGNKVVLQDGQTYVVAKNQFQNIKGNSTVAEGKKFAPELEGLEESIKSAETKKKIPEGYGEKPLEQYKAELKRQMPKYENYTLPGGENYREVLIKAPVKPIEGELPTGKIITPIGGRDYLGSEVFKSSHWDEPNVISHLRLNDRTYKGKKVTFMEELQSDWAREGRDKGFSKNLPRGTENDIEIKFVKSNVPEGHDPKNYPGYYEAFDKRTGDFLGRGGTKPDLMERALEEINLTKGIPYNPLLKNWQELSIKRALKDAVDNNSDYFAWTTGEQQSARYNLATYLDNVEWKKTGKDLTSPKTWKEIDINSKKGKDLGSILIDENGIIKEAKTSDWKGKKLDEVIGKGLADKIMEKETGTLSGEGLKFGGEWANNLYDKQVKNIVEELTGGKVEYIDMGLPISPKSIAGGTGTNEFVSGTLGNMSLTKEDIKIGGTLRKRGGFGDSFVIVDISEDNPAIFKIYPIDQISTTGVEKENIYTPLWETALKNKEYIATLKNKAETVDLSKEFAPSEKALQPALKLTPEIKAVIKGEAPKLKKIKSPERINYLERYNINNAELLKDKDVIFTKFFNELKKNEPKFISITEDIASNFGGEYVYRMKSPESVLIKMGRRGDKFTLGNIDDALGSTVITDDIDGALAKATKDYKITNVDDFRKNPTFLGYKAVHLDVELPNGQIAEIQLNTRNGLIRKEEGHKTYEKWRKYIETAQGSDFDDILKKIPQENKAEFIKDVEYSNGIFDGTIPVPEEVIKLVEERIIKTKNLIDINNYGVDKSIDKI